MELPPPTKLTRQRSSEEQIIQENIRAYENAPEEEEMKENNRHAITQNEMVIDKRGKRSLRKLFGEKILGNVIAEETFAAYHKKHYGVEIARTQKGRISKRAIKDNVMKDYIEQLNEDQIKMSNLQEVDLAELKGKASMIKAQQRVMPSLLNLVAEKQEAVNIMPQKGFGRDKKVEQRSIGTDLNLAEYARATEMKVGEAAALVGAGQRSMVAQSEKEAAEKEIEDRLRKEIRLGGGPALDIIKREAGNIQEGFFGDNMIREINAGLTGLEQNPNIRMSERGLNQVTFKNILDEPEEKKEVERAGGILMQDEMLNGPDNEFQHADPNDDRELMNVGARKLAENNQYTGDQKDFMNRSDANKDIRGQIESRGLDEMLGRAPPRRRGDKREYEVREQEGKYDEEMGIERKEQDNIGGGQGEDEGMNMEDMQPIEGGQSMREIIENEIEKRLLQPRGQWSGNRGIEADFQRQALADRVGNGIKNSQALNYLRKTGIPYKMPSRSYANNSVGLIRNSNRSMILTVNELEP